MTWRDGVHLTHTSIWCDAVRRRDVCFVSWSDRIGAIGHGQLIGTPVALAMIGLRHRKGFTGHLAVPVRRPFTLGTLRLELIPSGRGAGAAALHVDARGRTVLYAGAVRTAHAPRGWDAAEVRTADAVVVAAPLGERRHALASIDEVAGSLIAWIRQQLSIGKSPTIVVDTALDGVEVAHHVGSEVRIAGSPEVRAAAKLLASFEASPLVQAPGKVPAATIYTIGERGAQAAGAVRALVSARAADPQPDFAAAFAWPFVAGHEQLLAWIEQTRARRVFVTGACAGAIVAALGDKAQALGPPQQMALFS